MVATAPISRLKRIETSTRGGQVISVTDRRTSFFLTPLTKTRVSAAKQQGTQMLRIVEGAQYVKETNHSSRTN